MSRTYRITPRAADDIRSIGQYTQINWGRKQRNRYLRVLDKRFAWLAENPGMGKHRTDIKRGVGRNSKAYCAACASAVVIT